MARLLDTNVRYFDNTVTTAQLNNSWGCLINVLDEVLLTGSNEQSILSIITIEDPEDSNYWISTIYLNPNHKFEKEIDVVEIKGVGDPIFDTVFRVQSVAENYITIAFDKLKITTKPSDFNILSQATIKLAPLGYLKTVSEPNKAIYKTKNNSFYLRVDNSCPTGYDPSWIKFARVSIYNAIDNLEDYYPRVGRLKAPYKTDEPLRAETSRGSGASGSYGESKWYYGGSSSNSDGIEAINTNIKTGNYPFEIIGDKDTFYLFIANKMYYLEEERVGYCFGKYTNTRDKNDSDNCILCCTEYAGLANGSQGPYYYSGDPGGWERFNALGRVKNMAGKYILNNIINSHTLSNSVKVSFVSTGIASASSRSTDFNYSKYDQTVNYSKVRLRGHYDLGIFYLGEMRGYYMIANNLQDYTVTQPDFKKTYKVINESGNTTTFIILQVGIRWTTGGTEYSDYQRGRVAFKLEDWE